MNFENNYFHILNLQPLMKLVLLDLCFVLMKQNKNPCKILVIPMRTKVKRITQSQQGWEPLVYVINMVRSTHFSVILF